MKILKIKLEIFNHNFHKYFSKINMSTNPYYTCRRRVDSNASGRIYLLIGGMTARRAWLPGLAWAGLGKALDNPFFQEPDPITIFCQNNEPNPITIFLRHFFCKMSHNPIVI